MSEALVIHESQALTERPSPKEIITQATEEANALAGVIENQKLYSMIQGKKFVKVEGWQTLACLRGCLPREVNVEELPEGRYVATVELVRMSDGAVLSRASAECGGPEDPIWAKRPPNARRSMAITRATGKVCRIGFAWVMALANYETTPLEEMPEEAREQFTPSVQKVQPVVVSAIAPPEGQLRVVGHVSEVSSKKNPTGTRYGVKTIDAHSGEAHWLNTWDDKLAEVAMKLRDGGDICEASYVVDGKGYKNLKDISAALFEK